MDPLKEILRTHCLVIPTNQRAFSWRKEQADALIEDLKLMGENSHYLGPLIVTPGENQNFRDENTRDYIKEYIVDDGQQRLTTCLLLIKALTGRFDYIGENFNSHCLELKSFLTYTHQGEHLRIRNCNSALDQFLRHLVLGHEAPQTRTSAMKCLEEVSSFFEQFAADLNLEELIDWKLRLTAQAKFILVDLGTEDIDRYLAFDAINSRGLALTEFDKIKNFCALLSNRRPNLQIQPEVPWYRSLVALERFGISSRLYESTYIAEAFSIFFKIRIGPDEAHNKFVTKFGSLLYQDDPNLEEQLSKFVEYWEPFAQAFGFVSSEKRDTVDQTRATAKARDWLKNIDHLGLPGICRPLLCAALMKYESEDFEKVAKYAEVYTFRVHAIAGKRTDNNKSGINELAHQVYFERISLFRVSQILCFWLDQYCPMRELLKKLSDGEPKYHYDRLMKGWEYCYYFLYQYELHLSPITTTPIPWERSREQRKATIEHILPQTHRDNSYWQSLWPDELKADSFRHRLGNLVLTDGNSNLGHKPFPDKLNNPNGEYCYNHATATNSEKRLHEYTNGHNWREEEILKREAEMVRFAANRWTFGCCSDNIRFSLPTDFDEALGVPERVISLERIDCIAAADSQENMVVDEILTADSDAEDEADVTTEDDENTETNIQI